MRGGKGLPHSRPVTEQAPHGNLTRGGPQTREMAGSNCSDIGRNLAQEHLGVEALPLNFPFIPEYYRPKKSDLNVRHDTKHPMLENAISLGKFYCFFLEFKKGLLIPIKCNYVSVNS